MASLAERIALLAPAIVIGVGALAFLALLWGKIIREQLRGSRHSWLVVGGIVVAVGLLTVLSARA